MRYACSKGLLPSPPPTLAYHPLAAYEKGGQLDKALEAFQQQVLGWRPAAVTAPTDLQPEPAQGVWGTAEKRSYRPLLAASLGRRLQRCGGTQLAVLPS